MSDVVNYELLKLGTLQYTWGHLQENSTMRLLWVFLLTTAVLIKNIEGSGGKSSWEGGNSWKGGKGWKGGKDHWKGGKGWKGGSWKGGKASPLESCPKGKIWLLFPPHKLAGWQSQRYCRRTEIMSVALLVNLLAIRNIWWQLPSII